MNSVRDLLVRARARIAGGWCQGYWRTTRNGVECFCAGGALVEGSVHTYLTETRYWQALERVLDALPNKGYDRSRGGLAMWNDHPVRTQADVLALYDRAIEAAA